MKKILSVTVALTAISLATSAFANDHNIKHTPLSGAYVGAYGGYNWSDADTSIAGFNPDLEGWDGGVFVGYRLDALMERTNGMGIGLNGALEVFYGGSNSDGRTGAVKFEKGDEWGVSFRPGLSFMESMTAPLGINPYGIIGYRNTEFEALSGTASSSDRYNGFDLGIGTELVAYGDFGVRADYTHTWYASQNGIDPDADDLRVGLSYHF